MASTAQAVTDLTWVQTTLPTSAKWISACYGDGKFVAVAYFSTIAAYSEDGINWTQTTLPTRADWYSVCYGDGKFVAVADGVAAYSEDGIAWTKTTLPDSRSWHSVCYGDDKFVTVEYGVKTAAYSTDGVNWTQTTMPHNAYWSSVCYGNGKFVAVAENTDVATYSTDGVAWIQTKLPVSKTWHSVCYGNGKFVAVASNYDIVVYSEDGINWTQTRITSAMNWQSVCYGDGKFVAVAEYLEYAAHSEDGIEWRLATLPGSSSWSSVCYGNGKFVAMAFLTEIAAYALSAEKEEEKSGPPTENTPGAVGEIYVDPSTGLRWECTESYTKTYYKGTRTFYNWVERGLDPEFVVDGLNDDDEVKEYVNGQLEEFGGQVQEYVNGQIDIKIKSNALPVRLDLYTNVCANESGNYTLPSSITLTEGDEYVLQYRYLVNNVEDRANSIFAVAAVTDGVVRWGSSSPDNSITLTSTQVTDTWCPSDDTHRGVYTIYKVEKVVDDYERIRYRLMTLEGYDTFAPGLNAHAEGCGTVASGTYSHAEGTNTIASGDHSHAEGFNTKASGPKQHVEGMYNVADSDGKYAHIVGNGQDDSSRSNAHTLDWNGNAWFAGNVEADGIIIASSTAGSTKRFKITVNDEGTLTATEVTA